MTLDACFGAARQNQNVSGHGAGGLSAHSTTLNPGYCLHVSLWMTSVSRTGGHPDPHLQESHGHQTEAGNTSTPTAQGAYASVMSVDNMAHAGSSAVSATNVRYDGHNINDGVCVICLDRQQNAGFVHGNRCVTHQQ